VDRTRARRTDADTLVRVATTPRFLQLADVAEVLNISAAQVYALVRKGDLPAIKIGGRGQWRVEASELEGYIARMYDETRNFVAKHPLGGDRPASQLVRWTTTEVYDEVSSRVVPSASGGRAPARALVRSVHVTEPADGIAEVAASVRRGPRCTAVALRFEGMDGRWQCTALELG